MEAAGRSLAPQVASSLRRKAARCSPVSFCRLASCRAAVAHPFEPGTLITALSLSQCCAGSWTYSPPTLSPPPTTASLSYASPCVIVVVVFSPPAFRLFSATLSPLASLFLYWFACPQSSLRPRSLLLLSALRVVVCPIYLFISPICLLPSRPF